jgi:hypothetical protein
MESRPDYPHTKAWEIPLQANILSPNKPNTDHIQDGKKSVNTKSSIWLQTKTFKDRTIT